MNARIEPMPQPEPPKQVIVTMGLFEAELLKGSIAAYLRYNNNQYQNALYNVLVDVLK